VNSRQLKHASLLSAVLIESKKFYIWGPSEENSSKNVKILKTFKKLKMNG
jgi:hypothetical protein